MATSALNSASNHLNNLLLARGFLEDGKAIDFVQLASERSEAKNKTIDRNITTTRIVNLMHDLIRRRDRDAEQKEAFATTIRSMRAEEGQRMLEFQRQQSEENRLRNTLSTLEAQKRTFDATIKRVQAETKQLKEQMLKMKSALNQARAKCICDIRKRDVELNKLKTHLSGLDRGRKQTAAGGMKINTINIRQTSSSRNSKNSQNNYEGQWILENETHDFLAAVVKEATTENVLLRKIVGDSMRYLRILSEVEDQHCIPLEPTEDTDNAIEAPGQYQNHSNNKSSNRSQSESIIPVQTLGSAMTEVLSHCRAVFSDRSFVRIEEVQKRDEEIARLRTGCEKMADRWKEAVTMMGQWKQQMLSEQGHSPEQDLKQSQILQDESLAESSWLGTREQTSIDIHIDEEAEESTLDLSTPLTNPNANPKKRKLAITSFKATDALPVSPNRQATTSFPPRKQRLMST